MVEIILAIAFFACAAYLGVELGIAMSLRIDPLEDAPPSVQPPGLALAAAGALIGAAMVTRGASPASLGCGALVVLALAACWASDSLRGVVLDVFTLAPLAILLVAAVLRRDWLVPISAFVVGAPFAVAALSTRGRGMGWGDVKLAALAGAALGAPLAILAMILACLAAVAGYRIKRIKSGPIAFAPYLAAAIGVALPFGVL